LAFSTTNHHLQYSFIHSLVIITDFDVKGIAIDELKTNAPLTVNCNGMLPFAISAQCMQAIARGDL
ncbi:MAG: hypothetical protein MJK04_27290, partial [Psychrosphaera sp.]|nr:hypothetical protein [Psychrosphaera sp.]